jgi:hemin uptake protein HemP
MTTTSDRGRKEPSTPPPKTAKRISAVELFGGEREVWIEHDGIRYRLRITRRNKLILQK